MTQDLEVAFAVQRLQRAAMTARELFPDNDVRVLAGERVEIVGLLIDGVEVAVFGPASPMDTADAFHSFLTHLVTRVTAEA